MVVITRFTTGGQAYRVVAGIVIAGAWTRRRRELGARRCVRRTARLGASLFRLIRGPVMFHVAGRFRVLLRVHGRDMHAEGVGAVKIFRAVFAADAFEFPG